MSRLIKPKRLSAGDKVAAVSTSWGGPGTIPARYEVGKKQFEEKFGVKVVEMPNTLKSAAWLNEHPEARAQDLMSAFSDPSIKAIISTIGGDESIRILPFLDLQIIRRNPKIVMGYSDTTVTHFACYKAGLTSFYGPSFMAGLAENGGIFQYMSDSLQRTLFSNEPIGFIVPNSGGWTVERLDWNDPNNQKKRRPLNPATPWKVLQGKGVVEGHFLGGCIEVMEFIKGTTLWPSLEEWQDAILFIETSEEAPSPLLFERWLRNYASQGILQILAGIIVGRPGGGIVEGDFSKYDEALLKVVNCELGLTSLPIVTRMDFGHTDPFFTIPYGVSAEIHCETGRLFVPQSAVT